MPKRATGATARCEYCRKIIILQDSQGQNVDGNIVVLEVDGSQRRACKECAVKLSSDPQASILPAKKGPDDRTR